ncbi:MAG: hypothetical protein HY293_21280 [Planctomycetes bacterium]|nr:hypothetical protein [Planctomycetota bacterium]
MVAARLGTPQPVLTEAYYPYDYYGWRADPYWYGWPCVSWWWWCRPYGYWHHPAPAVRRYRVVP